MGVTIPGPSGEVLEQYEVSNSLRFNDDDSAYLEKNFSSDGSRQKFTWSAWIKRSTLGANQVPFGAAEATGRDEIRLNSSDQFQVFFGDASDANLITNRVFRDVSAWYHFVVAVDTTNGTANNRIRVYVNGVEETSFGTRSNPSENYQMDFTADCPHRLGVEGSGTTLDFDGYMTEVNFVDGQQYDPTYFGRFNENNVWVPKRYTGTYGTNGFFLEFKQTGTSANSSGIGADTSGNDSHFTPTNLAANDVTEDTCTNNFMTLNSVLADGQFNTSELSEGNTFYNEGQGNNGDGQPTGTFAFNSGKWYWEVQVPSQQNSRAIGFCRMDRVGIDQPPRLHGNGFTATNSVVGIDLQDNTIDQVDNAGTHTQHASGLTGMSNNDIFGVAVNLDDGNFQFYRNGSTYGSSYSLSNLSEWQEHGAVPCASGKTYQAYRFNFGNPAFSISSGNTDGKYGNFEYAPPSGYYALCTKRLAEFG